MNEMIIGYEAKRAFHNHSGLGNYSRHLISTLAAYQPENTYYLYNPAAGSVNYTLPAAAKEIKPGISNKLFANIWRQRLLSSRAKKDGVALFHGLSAELPYGLAKKGVKSVVTVHDLIFLRYPDLYKPIDRKIYLKKVKHACDAADVVVAVSCQTREDIIAFLGIAAQKIVVIYQGCDALYWQNHKANYVPILNKFQLPERFALFVGTLEQRKNPDALAEACTRLKIPLVLVGKSTAWWDKYINSASAETRSYCQHIRVQNTRDLATIYQLADLFVYPSVFEGFGIPVLEALASKCPVITGNNSALKEVAGPGSMLIDVENQGELENAIAHFWKNEDARASAAEIGFVFAQQFRDEALAQQWFATYRKVLGHD